MALESGDIYGAINDANLSISIAAVILSRDKTFTKEQYLAVLNFLKDNVSDHNIPSDLRDVFDHMRKNSAFVAMVRDKLKRHYDAEDRRKLEESGAAQRDILAHQETMQSSLLARKAQRDAEIVAEAREREAERLRRASLINAQQFQRLQPVRPSLIVDVPNEAKRVHDLVRELDELGFVNVDYDVSERITQLVAELLAANHYAGDPFVRRLMEWIAKLASYTERNAYTNQLDQYIRRFKRGEASAEMFRSELADKINRVFSEYRQHRAEIRQMALAQLAADKEKQRLQERERGIRVEKAAAAALRLAKLREAKAIVSATEKGKLHHAVAVGDVRLTLQAFYDCGDDDENPDVAGLGLAFVDGELQLREPSEEEEAHKPLKILRQCFENWKACEDVAAFVTSHQQSSSRISLHSGTIHVPQGIRAALDVLDSGARYFGVLRLINQQFHDTGVDFAENDNLRRFSTIFYNWSQNRNTGDEPADVLKVSLQLMISRLISIITLVIGSIEASRLQSASALQLTNVARNLFSETPALLLLLQLSDWLRTSVTQPAVTDPSDPSIARLLFPLPRFRRERNVTDQDCFSAALMTLRALTIKGSKKPPSDVMKHNDYGHDDRRLPSLWFKKFDHEGKWTAPWRLALVALTLLKTSFITEDALLFFEPMIAKTLPLPHDVKLGVDVICQHRFSMNLKRKEDFTDLLLWHCTQTIDSVNPKVAKLNFYGNEKKCQLRGLIGAYLEFLQKKLTPSTALSRKPYQALQKYGNATSLEEVAKSIVVVKRLPTALSGVVERLKAVIASTAKSAVFLKEVPDMTSFQVRDAAVGRDLDLALDGDESDVARSPLPRIEQLHEAENSAKRNIVDMDAAEKAFDVVREVSQRLRFPADTDHDVWEQSTFDLTQKSSSSSSSSSSSNSSSISSSSSSSSSTSSSSGSSSSSEDDMRVLLQEIRSFTELIDTQGHEGCPICIAPARRILRNLYVAASKARVFGIESVTDALRFIRTKLLRSWDVTVNEHDEGLHDDCFVDPELIEDAAVQQHREDTLIDIQKVHSWLQASTCSQCDVPAKRVLSANRQYLRNLRTSGKISEVTTRQLIPALVTRWDQAIEDHERGLHDQVIDDVDDARTLTDPYLPQEEQNLADNEVDVDLYDYYDQVPDVVVTPPAIKRDIIDLTSSPEDEIVVLPGTAKRRRSLSISPYRVTVSPALSRSALIDDIHGTTSSTGATYLDILRRASAVLSWANFIVVRDFLQQLKFDAAENIVLAAELRLSRLREAEALAAVSDHVAAPVEPVIFDEVEDVRDDLDESDRESGIHILPRAVIPGHFVPGMPAHRRAPSDATASRGQRQGMTDAQRAQLARTRAHEKRLQAPKSPSSEHKKAPDVCKRR